MFYKIKCSWIWISRFFNKQKHVLVGKLLCYKMKRNKTLQHFMLSLENNRLWRTPFRNTTLSLIIFLKQHTPHLVDVGDKLALSGHVDFLVVGSHFTLNCEQKDFQVTFLCEPEIKGKTSLKASINSIWIISIWFNDSVLFDTLSVTYIWFDFHTNFQEGTFHVWKWWNTHLGGFSTVRYVLKAWSCCWTPTRELANLRLFRMMMVCSIHSRRSDARDSYFSIIFSVSMALSST